jgi:hypothetical protein
MQRIRTKPTTPPKVNKASIYDVPLTHALRIIDNEALKNYELLKPELKKIADRQTGPHFKNPKKLEEQKLLKQYIQLLGVWVVERSKVMNHNKFYDDAMRTNKSIIYYHELIKQNTILVAKIQSILDPYTIAFRILNHIREMVTSNIKQIRYDPRNSPTKDDPHKPGVQEFKKLIEKCSSSLLSGEVIDRKTYMDRSIALNFLYGVDTAAEVIDCIRSMTKDNDDLREKYCSVQKGDYIDGFGPESLQPPVPPPNISPVEEDVTVESV